MNSPAKVATLLCFCSRSWYPWQTAWIQSSCLQMMPLLLPGVTRVLPNKEVNWERYHPDHRWALAAHHWATATGHQMDLELARHRSEGGEAGTARVSLNIRLSLGAHKILIHLSVYVPFCRRRYLVWLNKPLPLLLKQEGDYWNRNIKIRA